jgi:hypothetical protein
MSAQLKRSTWPLVCILGCLFILSVAAPRAWEHAARRQATTELAEQVVVDATVPEIVTPVPQRIELSAQPPVVPTQALVSSDETASASTPEAQAVQPAEKIASHPIDLDDPTASLPVIDDEGLEGAEAWTVPDQSTEPEMDEASPWQFTEASSSAGPSLLVAVTPPQTPPARAPAPLRPMPAVDSSASAPSTTKPAQPIAPSTRTASTPAPVAKSERWKMPATLVERLQRLSGDQVSATWAAQTEGQLRQLTAALNANSGQIGRLFVEVQQHLQHADRLAEPLAPQVAADLRRTAHAVARRLEIWRKAWEVGGTELATTHGITGNLDHLLACLDGLKGLDGQSPLSPAWIEYLLVDRLRAAAQRADAAAQQETRRLARQVLARLLRAPMNERQLRLVESPSVVALRKELERWAAEPVALVPLLDAMEQFERSGLASDGRRVAEAQFRLSFSPVEAEQQLARRLDNFYRNANLRMVLTKTLINRLLPEPKAECEPVRDTVLGYPVRGRSWNEPQLSVDFIPNAERLLMTFQVRGRVSSLTASTAGPATFFSSGEAYYEAHKRLEIEAGGIHLHPAEVLAYSDNRLRGLRTSFDAIPIVGTIVQSIARSQHEQRQPEANAEVEWKISTRAQERVDHEAYARVSAGVERLRERVFVPLNNLELNPVMIEARTSAERMTMRLRLAGDDQLGSQTPRPRAPSDSLASLQLHETAINNLLGRLELNGRAFTLPELSQHIAQRLHREPWPWSTEHEDVTIRFADENPVMIRCQDGRVTLNLAVAELRSPPRVWRDFCIRVAYRPVIHGRSAELARDGVVQLIGRLSTGAQIAVRGIFSKTFSKDDTLPISPEWLAKDSRLDDLAISQFAIEDGWVSLAYSPCQQQHTASRPLLDRRGR